jgi:hypothetical protein
MGMGMVCTYSSQLARACMAMIAYWTAHWDTKQYIYRGIQFRDQSHETSSIEDTIMTKAFA